VARRRPTTVGIKLRFGRYRQAWMRGDREGGSRHVKPVPVSSAAFDGHRPRPPRSQRYRLCRCRVRRNILAEEPYTLGLLPQSTNGGTISCCLCPCCRSLRFGGHQLEAVQRLCNTDSALIEGIDALSDAGRPGLLREQDQSPISYCGGSDYPRMPGWRNRQTQRT
jgi:hypothetical protein